MIKPYDSYYLYLFVFMCLVFHGFRVVSSLQTFNTVTLIPESNFWPEASGLRSEVVPRLSSAMLSGFKVT